jgi:hypothetical protein
MPLNPALRRQKQADLEFKAKLGCIVLGKSGLCGKIPVLKMKKKS